MDGRISIAWFVRSLGLALFCTLVVGCPDEGDFTSEAGVPDFNPFVRDEGVKPDAYVNPCGSKSPPSLKGKVLAPNGIDPVAGASVGVPLQVQQLASGVRCESCVVQGRFKSHTYTRSDGSFSLDRVPLGTVNLAIQKGRFRRIVTFQNVKCGDALTLTTAQGALPGKNGQYSKFDTIPNIAVITGAWDKMEKVLDKLGVKEKQIFDGKNWGTGTYSMQALIQNAGRMKGYHLILINCGTKFETLVVNSKAVRDNIRAYVKAGGRLFVTDYSYDYVEQVFPDFIDFEGSDSTAATTAEEHNAAELGTKVKAIEATIKDTQLKSWMGLTEIKALLPNGKVSIVGLDTSWAVQKTVNLKTTAKVWVEGGVTFIGGSGTRPLTASYFFKDSDNTGCGRVVFSSYHTHGEGTSLLPQERILEYLILEIGECRQLE